MHNKVKEEGMKKKHGGFTLSEFLWAVTIACFVMASFMVPAPAQAFDLSRPLGLGDEKTLQVDVTLKAGRPFEADYSVTDEVENLNVSAREHEWYLESEVGIKVMDTVRVFGKWETLTNIYAQREYGLELLIPISGIDTGIWASHINRTDFKVAQDKYGMYGIVVRF